MHDGEEKKDPENGEKDDITYADLDKNALTGNGGNKIWIMTLVLYYSKFVKQTCGRFVLGYLNYLTHVLFVFQETEKAALQLKMKRPNMLKSSQHINPQIQKK